MTDMPCDEFVELVTGFLDGALDPGDQAWPWSRSVLAGPWTASGVFGMLVLGMHDLRVDVNVAAVVVDAVLAVELFVLPAELRIDEPADQRPQKPNQDTIDDNQKRELDCDVRRVGHDRDVFGEESTGVVVFGLSHHQGRGQRVQHEGDSHILRTIVDSRSDRLTRLRARPAMARR